MVEEANNEQATDISSADEQTQQQPREPEPFIILPFDEEMSFQSANELKKWIDNEIKEFSIFLDSNKFFKNVTGEREGIEKIQKNLSALLKLYIYNYEIIHKDIDDIFSLVKLNELHSLKEKKEKLISSWTEFVNSGLVPMQSSFGECALAMSKLQNSTQSKGSSDNPEPRLSLTWLNAITVLRKQHAAQLSNFTDIKTKIAKDTELLVTLEEDIKAGQGKIKLYEENIEAFRNKALREAALKSPADALSDLEKVHKDAANRYFYITAGIVATWILISMTVYYHFLVQPIIGKATEVPLETGAVAITGMVFTGIVLTSIIIFLRLGVSRINFSIAAGERKAMAAAYRALLGENAISDDQQLLFLQSIVGSKLPDFVNSNDIRMPAEEIAKIVQAASKEK